jgi:hypothetical protein
MYKKEKAEKLAKGFNYLIDTKYYPLGKKGDEYNIFKVKSELTQFKNDWTLVGANSDNPDYSKQKEKKHSEGANWEVYICAKHKKDNLEVELERGLKKLNIAHDIDKLFND